MIEIWAVGGYSEIGSKNMTAIKVDDEVVILDMGYNVEKIVNFEGREGEEITKLSYKEMLKIDAVPDDTELKKEWGDKVKAIVVGHGHLDHCGAVRLLAKRYKQAPIIATPFTIEIIKKGLEGKRLYNKIIPLPPSSEYRISKNINIELINMTHSTLQTVAVAIHTPYGSVLYTNDFKLDNKPVLGEKPDYNALEKVGKNCIAQISDCTCVDKSGHTPSETLAKGMLRDILLRYKDKENGIIVSTFSSHIPRLSTLVKISKEIGREPVFIGRSLFNYLEAAKKTNLYSTDAEIAGFVRQRINVLRKINQNREKYVIICTGNQGEPNAVLSKIANDETPYRINDDDVIIFSCAVIPTPTSEANRKILERKLSEKNTRIFKDVHVSGHASKADHRELLQILKPKHLIPTHGGMDKLVVAAEIARTMGYQLNETVHLLQDGKRLVIK